MRQYKKYFVETIRSKYATDYEKIISDIEKHYALIYPDIAFAEKSGNPIDKRLDFTAYFLALIKTLHEKGETYEAIRNVCLEVVTEYVKPKNAFHKFLKTIPPKLTNTLLAKLALKIFSKKVSNNSNPDGFVAEIITDQ